MRENTPNHHPKPQRILLRRNQKPLCNSTLQHPIQLRIITQHNLRRNRLPHRLQPVMHIAILRQKTKRVPEDQVRHYVAGDVFCCGCEVEGFEDCGVFGGYEMDELVELGVDDVLEVVELFAGELGRFC